MGADGVIYLCPPLRADGDAAMRMFNADGSEGVMCGNGVRCAAEFLYTHGVRRDCIRIDTPSAGQRVGDGLWQVEMGRFTAAPDAVGAVGLGGGPLLDVPLCAGGRAWRVHCVAVGNPHCVLFTHEPPPAGAELAAWGRALGHHPAFPGGINVEFAQPISPTGLAVTVWERGSGATLACGTGAWAAGCWTCLRSTTPTSGASSGRRRPLKTGTPPGSPCAAGGWPSISATASATAGTTAPCSASTTGP